MHSMFGFPNGVLAYAPVVGALTVVMVVVLATNGWPGPWSGGTDVAGQGTRMPLPLDGVVDAKVGGPDTVAGKGWQTAGIPRPEYEDLGIAYMPYNSRFYEYVHEPDHPVEMISRIIALYYAGTRGVLDGWHMPNVLPDPMTTEIYYASIRDASNRVDDTFASDIYNILRTDRLAPYGGNDPHDAEYIRLAGLHAESWRSGNTSSAQMLDAIRGIHVGHRVDAFGGALGIGADGNEEDAWQQAMDAFGGVLGIGDGKDDDAWRHRAYEVFNSYPYGGTKLYDAALYNLPEPEKHKVTRENVKEMMDMCDRKLPGTDRWYTPRLTHTPGSCQTYPLLRAHHTHLHAEGVAYAKDRPPPCPPRYPPGMPDPEIFCPSKITCSPIASGHDADALVEDLERHRQCHSYGFDVRGKYDCSDLVNIMFSMSYAIPPPGDEEYIRQKYC